MVQPRQPRYRARHSPSALANPVERSVRPRRDPAFRPSPSAPAPFVGAIRLAADASRRESDGLTLLGAVPDSPETEYGWIVPGPALRDSHREIRRVERFVEKPPEALARRLFEGGGLWNTFVSAGTASAFWTLASRYLPDLTADLESHARIGAPTDAARALELIYSRTASVNFSRATSRASAQPSRARGAGGLASGWSDWGSPQRVLRSLTGSPALGLLLARLGSTRAAAGTGTVPRQAPTPNASVACEAGQHEKQQTQPRDNLGARGLPRDCSSFFSTEHRAHLLRRVPWLLILACPLLHLLHGGHGLAPVTTTQTRMKPHRVSGKETNHEPRGPAYGLWTLSSSTRRCSSSSPSASPRRGQRPTGARSERFRRFWSLYSPKCTGSR